MSKRKAAKKLPTFDQFGEKYVARIAHQCLAYVDLRDDLDLLPDVRSVFDRMSVREGEVIGLRASDVSLLIDDNGERRWDVCLTLSAHTENQWNQTIRTRVIQLSPTSTEVVLNTVMGNVHDEIDKVKDKYKSIWLDQSYCLRNRQTNSVSASLKLLSPEGRKLYDRFVHNLGAKATAQGFFVNGSCWFRFRVKNENLKGIDENELLVFRDKLLDEGIDVELTKEQHTVTSYKVVIGPK